MQTSDFGLGKELVEDEAEDVILVFVGFDLRAHFVGRLPDLGGELLLIHSYAPCFCTHNQGSAPAH